MQPLSTISNAAYASAGAWVLATASGVVGVLYGIALVVLSVGSALYHGMPKGSRPTPGQRFDEVAMYAVLSALIVYIVSLSYPAPWLIHLAIWMIFLLGSCHDTLDSGTVIPSLSALAVVLLGLVVSWPLALKIAGWFALSALVRAVAERNESDIGHAAWHLMTATGFAYLWYALAA